MRNNFNNLFRDFFNEDLFWSNTTLNPLLNKINNNLQTTRDYSQNLPQRRGDTENIHTITHKIF